MRLNTRKHMIKAYGEILQAIKLHMKPHAYKTNTCERKKDKKYKNKQCLVKHTNKKNLHKYT